MLIWGMGLEEPFCNVLHHVDVGSGMVKFWRLSPASAPPDDNISARPIGVKPIYGAFSPGLHLIHLWPLKRTFHVEKAPAQPPNTTLRLVGEVGTASALESCVGSSTWSCWVSALLKPCHISGIHIYRLNIDKSP